MNRRTFLAFLGGGVIGGGGVLAMTGGGAEVLGDIAMPDGLSGAEDTSSYPWDHSVREGGIDGYSWADSWTLDVWINERHDIERLIVNHEVNADSTNGILGIGGHYRGSLPTYDGVVSLEFDRLLGNRYPSPQFVVKATKDFIAEYETLAQFGVTLPDALAGLVTDDVELPPNVAEFGDGFFAAELTESGVIIKAGLVKAGVEVVVENPEGEAVTATEVDSDTLAQRTTLRAEFDDLTPGEYTFDVYGERMNRRVHDTTYTATLGAPES